MWRMTLESKKGTSDGGEGMYDWCTMRTMHDIFDNSYIVYYILCIHGSGSPRLATRGM